ncbi:hypothetical protein E4U41_005193 [Claviceps citrina]|nr:hypothetical protein E4U41_005193 [Claviceps citrina]
MVSTMKTRAGTPASAHDFAARVRRVLRSVKAINLREAEIRSRPHDGRRVLVVSTTQGDTCPAHILEWTELEGGYVRVNSHQCSESVPPRSTKPGALRFIIPTATPKGVRKDLRALLEKLAGDEHARRRARVASVQVLRETPRDMEWLILLS